MSSDVGGKRGGRVIPSPAPRYDEVFFEGLAWLDEDDEESGEETMTEAQRWREVAEALWSLLDDIDTATDKFREPSSDSPFGAELHRLLKERHKFLKSDGYTLTPAADITIAELQAQAYGLARDKGWWDRDPIASGKTVEGTRSILSKLALVHAEVSEAVECAREGQYEYWTSESGKPEGMVVELADTVIRICDLCGALNLDLQSAIIAKHEYNKTRTHRHGGKLA